MGVPALFRWLSQKYPKILAPIVEQQPAIIDGEEVPIDTRGPNPNGEEFDNLYLDMNGIVHACANPEGKSPPANEAEMMEEIFKYTDRVVNMVRPRKLLMIAVDGVAPRAKMNQQRSRRFRSAQEAKEKEAEKKELLQMLKAQNGDVIDETALLKPRWDTNSITPGTPFMVILAASLRYWIAYKINTDPAWENRQVILSDAFVPGEGEHKIIGFIRAQRQCPDHDPNTKHVIYGLDADLIMLALGTHEPYFRVIREDVFIQQGKPRTCRLCGQTGHLVADCRGQVAQQEEQTPKPFIWLNVGVLREYLAVELYVPNLPFAFDLERALDDWVFLCFFIGNDFLPHLPTLEIREGGIDTLVGLWKDALPVMRGYVTQNGRVNLAHAQHLLAGLARQEDEIFRRRKQTEDRREANFKRRRYDNAAPPPEPPADTVMLWKEGYADRYYEQKFHVDPAKHDFRRSVAHDYALGLCWVMEYYFQDCPSWQWYYPHHYAPFAADFIDLASVQVSWQETQPVRPYEQLMSVMPAASRHTLPQPFHSLMTEKDSTIHDFYPEDFQVDMNGKEFAHQGVVLLPFVDQQRLLNAMATKYPLLSQDEVSRNEPGKQTLFFSTRHAQYNEIATALYSKAQQPSTRFQGLVGSVSKDELYIPGGALRRPQQLAARNLPELATDESFSVHYEPPPPGHLHQSRILSGVRFPHPTLTRDDLEAMHQMDRQDNYSRQSHYPRNKNRSGQNHYPGHDSYNAYSYGSPLGPYHGMPHSSWGKSQGQQAGRKRPRWSY